ncbi:MAG: diguanylate cyclase [Nitrospirota bacterium]
MSCVTKFCERTHACTFIGAVLLVSLMLCGDVLSQPKQEIRIGVLAYRGTAAARTMWDPTAAYLSRQIPEHSFTIVPLTFNEIRHVVKQGGVDFIITNPADYVEMEKLYGVNRIATLRNYAYGSSYTQYGGVIFTRADREDIRELTDLANASFMAVEENSLGGWWMALRELKRKGIDPYKDFKKLEFGGTHDAVVFAVRDGKVDAGTVRTCILERMVQEGKIDLDDFRILNRQYNEEFLFLHSTSLYPEWPIARVRHTSEENARKVTIALLNMPRNSRAARAAGSAGWTIPLDYQPVHECLKELKVGIYKDSGKITAAELLRAYWYWFALAAAAITLMAITTTYVMKLNRRLSISRAALEQARHELEERVMERTAELERVNADLRQEIIVRTWAEEALRESEERYRDLFENANDLIQSVAPDGTFQYVNNAWRKALGYTEEEVSKLTIFNIIHPDCHAHCGEMFQRVMAGEVIDKVEVVFVTKEGRTMTVEGSVNCNFVNGKLFATRAIFRDVTERKMMEEKLRDLAERDTLTNIYNRRKFYEVLERELQRSARYKIPLSLILFDIDDFKKVNDTFGHAMGDAVLVTATNIVSRNIRSTDVFARFGGEEFILLAPETELEGAVWLAEKIRKEIESQFFSAVGEVTVSIGVTELNENDIADSFIKRADDALYQAKGRGKNRVEVLTIDEWPLYQNLMLF